MTPCGPQKSGRQSLHAEVLFLRRQLALYVERGVKPRRIDAATRVSLALLSRLFDWRSALVVVQPQHPTAAWTRQQLRQALGFDTHYGYLLHDRDSIFSRELDAAVGGLGLRILKTPPRCPMANGLCERVIGTIRRECLDWLIPLSEAHLRRALRLWVEHYNRRRPT